MPRWRYVTGGAAPVRRFTTGRPRTNGQANRGCAVTGSGLVIRSRAIVSVTNVGIFSRDGRTVQGGRSVAITLARVASCTASEGSGRRNEALTRVAITLATGSRASTTRDRFEQGPVPVCTVREAGARSPAPLVAFGRDGMRAISRRRFI